MGTPPGREAESVRGPDDYYYTALSRSTTLLNLVRSQPARPHANRKLQTMSQSPLLRSAEKVVLLSLLASSIGSAYSDKHVKSAALLSMRGAARVLDQLSKKSQNTVPDAVLNSTKCVVVIPSITGGTVNSSAGGVASCREAADSWSAPAFVKFNWRGTGAHSTDLLVFILSDTGVRALRSGELQIGGQKQAAAPLVSTTPVTTQVELTAGFFTYEGAGGVLSSSEASGVVRRDAETSDAVHNAVPKKAIEKYLSSVVSFFNTITATGIVIHHTAVIPGADTVPGSERNIDEYHQARGFEILCFGRLYHVAYHYLVMPNGSVQAGRPERCEGAHAQGYNSYLGISVVGDFSSEDNPTGKKGPINPSAEQIASLIQLCRRLKDHYHIPLQHIVRHSDISSTRCPGDRFPFKSVLDQLQWKPPGVNSKRR
ncbi:MAG: N-acetylmuramoyl-L-alanine amidase family 2 [Acidobacteriaceae bacterium]|nr:N-acetylmuramoyl-L-alanine amidase family 2 [Acidobacteriaceae bacterium]